MTGTEILMLGLGGTHIVAALAGWYVGHHGFKAAIATVQGIPATVTADVSLLKANVAALQAKLP